MWTRKGMLNEKCRYLNIYNKNRRDISSWIYGRKFHKTGNMINLSLRQEDISSNGIICSTISSKLFLLIPVKKKFSGFSYQFRLAGKQIATEIKMTKLHARSWLRVNKYLNIQLRRKKEKREHSILTFINVYDISRIPL